MYTNPDHATQHYTRFLMFAITTKQYIVYLGTRCLYFAVNIVKPPLIIDVKLCNINLSYIYPMCLRNYKM